MSEVVREAGDRLLRRAWCALLALSLLAIVVIAVSERLHRSNIAAYEMAQRADMQKFDVAARAFRAEDDANPGLLAINDPAQNGRARLRRAEELKQSLFPGRTPTTLPALRANQVRWPDPKRGVVFGFEFRADGTWQGMDIERLPAPAPPAPPPVLRFMRAIDPLRRMWVGSFTPWAVGPVLWAASFLASVFWLRRSRLAAHAVLAVAWLSFLGWLLNPNYPISYKGIVSNDMLFWGTLMLIASGFLVGFTYWRLAAMAKDTTRCRACGYDLTGNVSGVCPECGTRAVEPPMTQTAPA